MNLVQHTFETLHLRSWVEQLQQSGSNLGTKAQRCKIDFLAPLRQWLDNVEVKDSVVAHRICKLIPNQCPFSRAVKIWGRTIVTIPPLCKLNPLYNELIALRFRAICYLADDCGEDISIYC